jgi:hypothetical protein
MSDDDLLAKLRGLGVDADREKLAGLCDGALSAEEVVSERLGLHGWDADWAWICLTGLWQRWWPEKACLELLDDKIQEGYDADQRNDFVAARATTTPTSRSQRQDMAWCLARCAADVRCHRRRVDQGSSTTVSR